MCTAAEKGGQVERWVVGEVEAAVRREEQVVGKERTGRKSAKGSCCAH